MMAHAYPAPRVSVVGSATSPRLLREPSVEPPDHPASLYAEQGPNLEQEMMSCSDHSPAGSIRHSARVHIKHEAKDR